MPVITSTDIGAYFKVYWFECSSCGTRENWDSMRPEGKQHSAKWCTGTMQFDQMEMIY